MAVVKKLVKKNRTWQVYAAIGATPVVVVALAALTMKGVCLRQDRLAFERADTLLGKGFGALAAEELEGRRFAGVKDAKRCETLIRSYVQSRRNDRLEWAAQACLDAGHESADAYLGLASVQQAAGREQVAIQILSSVEDKYKDRPDVYYALAQLYRRLKQDDGAAHFFQLALEKAPQNQQLGLEILEYYAGLERWDLARSVADKLRGIQTENPEVKLFIARALLRGGDQTGSARTLASDAMALASKNTNPGYRANLEKRYGDVLSASGRVPAGAPPKPASPNNGFLK